MVETQKIFQLTKHPPVGIYKRVSLHDPKLKQMYQARVEEIQTNKSDTKTNAFAPTFKWVEAEKYRREMHNTTRNRLEALRFDRAHGSSGFKVWSGNNSPLEMKYIIMSHFYEDRPTRKQGLINSLFTSERQTQRIIRMAEESEQIVVSKGKAGARNTTIIQPSTRMVFEYEEHLEQYYLRAKEQVKDSKERQIYTRWETILKEYGAFKELRDEKLPATILKNINTTSNVKFHVFKAN